MILEIIRMPNIITFGNIKGSLNQNAAKVSGNNAEIARMIFSKHSKRTYV